MITSPIFKIKIGVLKNIIVIIFNRRKVYMLIMDNPRLSNFTIVNDYMHTACGFLKTMFPEADDDVVREYVYQNTRADLKNPKIEVLEYPDYGVEEHHERGLLQHTEAVKTKIITPRGIYMPTSIKESSMRKNVMGKKARRSSVKKLQLAAENAGDNILARLKNNEQTSVKFNINSIFGCSGNVHTFLSDLTGFNAITSTGRTCIMHSYAHTERLLQGMYYFKNPNIIINYMQSLRRVMPSADKICRAIENAGIYFPENEDLIKLAQYNYTKYNKLDLPEIVVEYINKLELHEVAFIYYGGNMNSLMQGNEEYFRPWIEKFYPKYSDIQTAHYKPEDLFDEDEDLLIVIAVNYTKELDGVYFNDLPKKNPEAAKKVVGIARHMRKCLDQIQELFDVFINLDAEIPYIGNHKFMQRECVTNSDTDSVIFTTINWIKWYNGEVIVNDNAFKINSLVVYWLTKSVAQMLEVFCRHRNVAEADIPRLYMKNEFLYVAFFRTLIKKHYCGLAIFKEGRNLPKPKIDIKGVQFRGSGIPDRTLATVEKMLLGILDEIRFKGEREIDIENIMKGVVRYERIVYNSISNGALDYIGGQRIKDESQYKTPIASINFNYKVWEACWADRYGSIEIDSKCPILPIKEISVKKVHEVFADDPILADKLYKILSENKKKSLTRIPIPRTMKKVPDDLVKLIDIRKIMVANTSPFLLGLSAFGISLPKKNEKSNDFLFSDIYHNDSSIAI
jgi:hypothetical protein